MHTGSRVHCFFCNSHFALAIRQGRAGGTADKLPSIFDSSASCNDMIKSHMNTQFWKDYIQLKMQNLDGIKATNSTSKLFLFYCTFILTKKIENK